MSKNTLCDAIKNLELLYQLTPYQQKKCDEYFAALKEGDIIYPGHIKSKFGMNIKTVYQILERLKTEGFLNVIYEVYCRKCSKSKGIFINSISEFNSDWHCDFCNNHLNAMDNLIVLYKVVSL